MNDRPRPRISARMQRGLALKAFAYTGLSAGCFPIAGMFAHSDIKPMLAAFGLAFSLAALLAIVIFRRSLTQEQRTPHMSSVLGAGTTAVICLGIAQLVIIGTQVYLQLR